MEYTCKEFCADLIADKPLEYFKRKPIPTGAYLWHVVRDTNNIDIIDHYVDKLSHVRIIHCLIINNKLDIADHLISKGVEYNPSELKFHHPESIVWARRHNINIILNQIATYKHNLDMMKTIHEHYPLLISDIDPRKCTSDVLEYLLANCDIPITDSLVRYVLHLSSSECFGIIVSKIDVSLYLNEIAISSYKIVKLALDSGANINDFGMLLFTGTNADKKIIEYASLVDNFADKATKFNLIPSLMETNDTAAALYIVKEYNVCVDNLPLLESAKKVANANITYLHTIGIIDNAELNNYKTTIDNCDTTTAVYSMFKGI